MKKHSMRQIYLASSWRNPWQPKAVAMLRAAGHEVYDFRNPLPGNAGFAWSEIDPAWMKWTPDRFIEAIAHPIAIGGYRLDKAALDWCDTCVLLLPCGRSAHLEAGYAVGQGKPTFIVLDEAGFEPELMYLLAAKIVPDIAGLLSALSEAPVRCGECGEYYKKVLREKKQNADHVGASKKVGVGKMTEQELIELEVLCKKASPVDNKVPPYSQEFFERITDTYAKDKLAEAALVAVPKLIAEVRSLRASMEALKEDVANLTSAANEYGGFIDELYDLLRKRFPDIWAYATDDDRENSFTAADLMEHVIEVAIAQAVEKAEKKYDYRTRTAKN